MRLSGSKEDEASSSGNVVQIIDLGLTTKCGRGFGREDPCGIAKEVAGRRERWRGVGDVKDRVSQRGETVVQQGPRDVLIHSRVSRSKASVWPSRRPDWGDSGSEVFNPMRGLCWDRSIMTVAVGTLEFRRKTTAFGRA